MKLRLLIKKLRKYPQDMEIEYHEGGNFRRVKKFNFIESDIDENLIIMEAK